MSARDRLRAGDRVRHMLGDCEGVVVTVDRTRSPPRVVVRLDAGGTDETPMGEWEAMPAIAALGGR